MDSVVLICDDNYALPTVVCIKSIISNYSEKLELNVYVCSFSLSESNKIKIEGLSTNFIKVKALLFDERNIKERLSKISPKTHVSKSALLKFELPNIFYTLDKILYLDSDIIVKGDLAKIFDIQLHENYLAACFDFGVAYDYERFKPFWAKKPDFYFNSGVMLLNLSKMRKDCVSDKLWEYKINRACTTLMDQETLNAVCCGKVERLSIKWNLNPAFLESKNIPSINKIYSESFKTKKDLEENSIIVHYVGKADKPWVFSDARLIKYWDFYYKDAGYTEKLNRNEYPKIYVSWLEKCKSRIKQHGVLGFICYCFYKLRVYLWSRMC